MLSMREPLIQTISGDHVHINRNGGLHLHDINMLIIIYYIIIPFNNHLILELTLKY
jgi:hypothetical protein